MVTWVSVVDCGAGARVTGTVLASFVVKLPVVEEAKVVGCREGRKGGWSVLRRRKQTFYKLFLLREGVGGSERPTSRSLYSRFPPFRCGSRFTDLLHEVEEAEN